MTVFFEINLIKKTGRGQQIVETKKKNNLSLHKS